MSSRLFAVIISSLPTIRVTSCRKLPVTGLVLELVKSHVFSGIDDSEECRYGISSLMPVSCGPWILKR